MSGPANVFFVARHDKDHAFKICRPCLHFPAWLISGTPKALSRLHLHPMPGPCAQNAHHQCLFTDGAVRCAISQCSVRIHPLSGDMSRDAGGLYAAPSAV